MSVLLAAALAGASAAVAVALPRSGQLRFTELAPARARRLPPSAARRPRGWVVLAAGGVTLAVGPVPGLLALGGGVAAQREHQRRRRGRARLAERAGAVQACGVLAAELSAGRTAAEALAAAAEVAVGPAREALQAAAAASTLGGDVAAALRSVRADSAVGTALWSLAACWTVCAGSGGGLAAAVERLEEGLRADEAQRRAVDAELAGPRATAALLAVLPVFGLLMAAGLGADPLQVLLHTPLGLVCLVLGLGLEVLGLLWTGRLVARAGGTA